MKTLVVDRDPAVAHRLAEELGAAGVGEVFSAASAEDAVELVNDQHGIDVLATDVFLDGIDGFTLSETIREQLPTLRTIFLTDYDLSDYADRIGDAPVLAKPVDVAALAQVIGMFPMETANEEMPVAPEIEGAAADSWVGTSLGSYRIDAFLGEDLDGPFYQATQTTIGRTVELHTLAAARAAEPAEVERFLAAARAKANVHHAALLSVFEAGEHEGIYFYTSELRQGVSLWQIAENFLPQPSPGTLLQLLHTVAELMVHLGQVRTAHEPLHAVHVLIDARNHTRLVNIATHEPMGNTAVDDMRNLAAAILPVVPENPASGALRRLLAEMEAANVSVRSWTALIYEVKRCSSGDGTASGASMYRLDADGHAAIAAVGVARKRARMRKRILAGGFGLVVAAGLAFGAWSVFLDHYGNAALEKAVEVPAAKYIFQGKPVDVPAFSIDVYEVSIGQYADFLKWIAKHPEQAASVGPSEMPENHSFVPSGWADEKTKDGVKPGYFTIAQAGGEYEGTRLTLDSPVFGVDWFDAFCYATFKGRRLPSEIEWERAALGDGARKFPWGDEDRPANANLAGGGDAFPKWSPVDAMATDKSPFGAIGMGGNVSEWTLSITQDAKGIQTPVVRGANWSEPKLDIHHRFLNLQVSQSSPTVGFRTAADHKP